MQECIIAGACLFEILALRNIFTGRNPSALSQRQNLEQERDRNYAFLHQIIDHIPSQITVKDARDRRYLLVNRVAEAQFGLSRAAIVGETAINLFPRAAADKIAADDDKALQSADGLFLDEHPWESPGLGHRFVTSK